jgi:uncharacterized protein (DUF302 family)
MARQSPENVRTVPHEVHRHAVAVGALFDDFRERYEQAVPRLDAGRFEQLVNGNADWDTILRTTAENAPHGFIIYWVGDFAPLMRLAGDQQRCVSYLMGNHTIAERMYRHNPGIMMYAPLRTAIYTDAAGTTWFTADQPSMQFGSFGNPAITEVGIELDRKLAALLELLGAPVPDALTSGTAPTS